MKLYLDMNYLFSRLFFALLLLNVFTGNAGAQHPDSPLPDSLPRTDSLSTAGLKELALQISGYAKTLEGELSRKAGLAAADRDTLEKTLKVARQDTLTAKTALDSLSALVKNAKSAEKTAQKNQKQATQTLSFTERVAGMDSLNQKKNLPKAFRQVTDLERLLYPPPPVPEKPIAEILNAGSDSTRAMAKAETREKEKKPEKPARQYQPYSPANDVMLNPPQRPCSLAVNTRDEFSGETYREVQKEELFRFTNEIMKKVLPAGQPHIRCEAALSSGGATASLHLTFTLRDPNARKAFGSLPRNGVAVLKFLDGTTFSTNNLRNDDGAPDPTGQVFTYRAQYGLDATVLKKLRKNELDKIRVAWSTGYEDYDVQSVDLLMRQAKCLFGG